MALDDILKDKQFFRRLTYPISIDGYRINWNDWDILREFVSNALDAEDGKWDKLDIDVSDGSLSIQNFVKQLDIKDFYIGYSSQRKNIKTNYIGRFNEGMKIAIVSALRLGYKIEIRFGKFVANPSAVETEDGIRIFHFVG